MFDELPNWSGYGRTGWTYSYGPAIIIVNQPILLGKYIPVHGVRNGIILQVTANDCTAHI